jgi:hypothetical protein
MSYVNRIQIVLAEKANELKANGFSTWQPEDFYTAAKKFVEHLYTITLIGEDIGVTSRATAYADLMEHLSWDVPEHLKDPMVEGCLDELYAEFMQEED